MYKNKSEEGGTGAVLIHKEECYVEMANCRTYTVEQPENSPG